MPEITINEKLRLAAKYHNQGDLNQAEILYDNILKLDPKNPNALHLLGLIFYQKNNLEEATILISKAIESDPNFAPYYGNLGMVYETLGKEEESVKNFKKALKINPDYGSADLAHYNLGVYHEEKEELEEALQHYNKAIEKNPNFSDAHWNKSLILLLLEKFEEGWNEYKYRFKKNSPTDSRVFNKPEWDGSSLKDKKILILSEQGFGDNMQFIRYVPLVKDKGAQIIFECNNELKNLLNNFNEIDEFVKKEIGRVPKVEHDYYIHLMDLPRIFNTNLNNIPKKTPYIYTSPDLTEKFKPLFNKEKFNIGIVWSGNPNYIKNDERSTSPEFFKKLKDIPKVKLYSLQKGISSEQLNDEEIINIAEKTQNFQEVASLIINLDLIITVDTAMAHLAGAINKPVWVILSSKPDWRWFLNKSKSPWYPSMKLFRQNTQGSWVEVFNEVEKELRELVNER